ncbi:hypothetical protein Y032_0189g1203 [Ancylostoma ceylanicum]|nr:hypothetical protein Y032_0189g1203 [Ancylostoma ceylanicum]
MDLCCGTCNALSEYAHDKSYTTPAFTLRPLLYPTPPPGWRTSPSYNYCDDKDPEKCMELQERNGLNCVDNMKDVALCCHTCNNQLDYLEHIRYFS